MKFDSLNKWFSSRSFILIKPCRGKISLSAEPLFSVTASSKFFPKFNDGNFFSLKLSFVTLFSAVRAPAFQYSKDKGPDSPSSFLLIF